MDADSGATSLLTSFLLSASPPSPSLSPPHNTRHYITNSQHLGNRKKRSRVVINEVAGLSASCREQWEGKDGPPHAPSLRATLPLCLVSPCGRAPWHCARRVLPAGSEGRHLSGRASPGRAGRRQGRGQRAGWPEAAAPRASARSAEARQRAVLSTCQAACTTCLPAARRAPRCPPGASTASSRPGPRPAAGAGRHGSQPRSGGTVTGDSCFVESDCCVFGCRRGRFVCLYSVCA